MQDPVFRIQSPDGDHFYAFKLKEGRHPKGRPYFSGGKYFASVADAQTDLHEHWNDVEEATPYDHQHASLDPDVRFGTTPD